MQRLVTIFGVLLCLAVVVDAFQTIILPRRPSGRFRITRMFYIMTWAPWVALAEKMGNRKVRDQIYSVFGPLSLLLLLVLWAIMLVAGFALVYFGIGSPFTDPLSPVGHLPRWLMSMRTDLYFSGTTLFTLGLGDVTPKSLLVRLVVVVECGTGLGFVALVIGYVPVLYQAFSRREVSVAMLDARAGSPPTATELLRRHGYEGGQAELVTLLGEWERWAAEILESHISYPILCYYRSQHDNQSWLSALVAVLDACALLVTTVEGPTVRQAQLTFLMARHALIDLGHVFHVERGSPRDFGEQRDRLPAELFQQLCGGLEESHMRLCGDPAAINRLTAIRQMYEPHAQALADYLRMPLPLWVAEAKKTDPWKTVAGLRVSADLKPPVHLSERSTAINPHDEEHGFS